MTISRLRYTNVALHSYGSTTLGVVGHAKSESVSICGRAGASPPAGAWSGIGRCATCSRSPTTRYLGDETELGLTQMSSLGFGLELDSSALDRWVTRWRLVGRYKFGPGMQRLFSRAGGQLLTTSPFSRSFGGVALAHAGCVRLNVRASSQLRRATGNANISAVAIASSSVITKAGAACQRCSRRRYLATARSRQISIES